MYKSISTLAIVMLFSIYVPVISAQRENRTPAQPMDQGRMIEYENPYYESIQESIQEFNAEEETPRFFDADATIKDSAALNVRANFEGVSRRQMKFKIDFSNLDLPRSTNEFTTHWHNVPLSQGNAGTCWCFAATSTLEADCFRQTGNKYKFSELHTVYWEYVEKARRFVRERGDSHFSEGSQANAVLRIWKQFFDADAAVNVHADIEGRTSLQGWVGVNMGAFQQMSTRESLTGKSTTITRKCLRR